MDGESYVHTFTGYLELEHYIQEIQRAKKAKKAYVESKRKRLGKRKLRR